MVEVCLYNIFANDFLKQFFYSSNFFCFVLFSKEYKELKKTNILHNSIMIGALEWDTALYQKSGKFVEAKWKIKNAFYPKSCNDKNNNGGPDYVYILWHCNACIGQSHYDDYHSMVGGGY